MPSTLAVVAVVLLSAVSEPPPIEWSATPPDESPAATALPPLHVSLRTGRDRYEVKLDSATGQTTRRPVPAGAPIVIPLPGTDLSAELIRPSPIRRRDLYVVQHAADGSEMKRTLVCPLAENPRDVAWHVGWHRLIYIRGVGESATLRSRDPRSEHEATMTVGGVVQEVRVGPNDQIAAVSLIGVHGEERRADLTVFRGRAMRRIATGEDIGTLAWHPDGNRIVYSVPGELRMVTVDDRTTETVSLGDLDEALSNHLASSIDIAADGTMAIIMRISGDRDSVGSEQYELPGDREVYLLRWPGELRSIRLELEPTTVRWGR